MPVSDSQALDVHFMVVEGQTMAKVCAAKVPGFAAEFQRLYEAWRQANAEAIARGAELAEAKGWNRTDGGPNLQSFASMEAQILESIPADDRQRRCDELLERFAKRTGQ